MKSNQILPRWMKLKDAAKYSGLHERTIRRHIDAGFRGAIRANPQVLAMGPAGTLPTFLLFSAGVIARTFLIAMPVTQEGMTDPRKTENDSAETELKAVRTMNGAAFAIDEPAPAGDSGCYAYGGDRRLGLVDGCQQAAALSFSRPRCLKISMAAVDWLSV